MKIFCIIITALCLVWIMDHTENAGLVFTGKLFMMIILIIILTIFGTIYHLFFRTFGSYLYARNTLKMRIGFAEAGKLNTAFAPLHPFNKQWLPMLEIITIEDNVLKYETALATVKFWNDHNKSRRVKKSQEFANNTIGIKILRVIMYTVLAWCFIAGIFNLPPADYITDIYTDLFSDNHYYPMLNVCLLVLPVTIIFVLIEKRLKRR